MFSYVKLQVGKVLTSNLFYRLFVKPALRDSCLRTSSGLINVDKQSRYIQSLLFWGIYESSERRLITKYLKRETAVVELGASIGMTTITICSAINKNMPVLSVEANPYLIPNLLETKRINQFDNLRIINAAIDYSSREQVSFIVDSNNLGSQKGAGNSSVSVPAIQLAGILKESNIGSYALVSDIEGAEMEMFLSESDPCVFGNCSQMIMELHDTKHDNKAYRKEDIASFVTEKLGMKIIYTDGKTWVFEK